MLRTTAQQKALCKECPLAKAANLMGDSVTLLVVRDLLVGPKRFSDLEDSLAGISTRTLTKKLLTLQAEGFVIKRQSKGTSSFMEYSLTPKGKGLRGITEAMRAYGQKYL